MSRFRWDREAIIREASNYSARSAFRDNGGAAYAKCLARFPGLIDELFPRLIGSWKLEANVRAEAVKYLSRVEFRCGSPGASKAAICKFPWILEEIFGCSLRIPWTLTTLILEAQKYTSRQLFQAGSGGAYYAFLKYPEELNRIFPLKYADWSCPEAVKSAAAEYQTKAELIYGCIGAYGAARRYGILDELGLKPSGCGFNTTTKATLYIAELFLTDGTPGVIFGITNRTPRQRYTASERILMTRRTCFIFEVGAHALRMETTLRQLFQGFAVAQGDSPLRFKSGTAGEILRNVSVTDVIHVFQAGCSEAYVQVDW